MFILVFSFLIFHPSVYSFCEDSDGGVNPTVYGYCTDDKRTLYDHCDSRDYRYFEIWEAYCDITGRCSYAFYTDQSSGTDCAPIGTNIYSWICCDPGVCVKTDNTQKSADLNGQYRPVLEHYCQNVHIDPTPPQSTHKACQGTSCVDISGSGSDECTTNAECGGSSDTHKACQGTSCVDVSGSGSDECTTNAECGGSSDTHKACQGTSCVDVSGSGNDECTTNAECGGSSDTHKACQGTSCVDISGSGSDECTTDAECGGSVNTHKACQGSSCVDVDGAGQDECSSDSECAPPIPPEQNCSLEGGVWLSEGSGSGDRCCGDDAEADLGNQVGDYLCINDGSYQWIKGEECERYLTNKLLFSSHNWYFCINNSNYKVNSKEACSRECDFFCNIQDDTWASDDEYTLLSEPLSPSENIDTKKSSLNSTEACCPEQWCYDDSTCIENQVDEACDPYVYNYSGATNRCLNGTWETRTKQYAWSGSDYGYCPDETDCFVSCGNYSSNYQPDLYFTDEKPQCLSSDQFILDNYCSNALWNTQTSLGNGTGDLPWNGGGGNLDGVGNLTNETSKNKWSTRTSLLATKLIQLAADSDFAIHCDTYQNILNEYNYQIDLTPVTDYLTSKCHIGNEEVPCTNNFCVMKNLATKQIFFGTTLNQPLFSANNGFNQVINLDSCTGGNVDAWSYSSCGSNAIYNEFLKSIIYSDTTIPDVSSADATDIFLEIIKHPITSLKNLIQHGTIFYVEKPSEIKLAFPLLNETP